MERDFKQYARMLTKLFYAIRCDVQHDLNNYITLYNDVVMTEFYYPNLKYAILTGANFAMLPNYTFIDRYRHYDSTLLPNFNIVAIKRSYRDGTKYTTGLDYDIMLYFDIPDYNETNDKYIYNNLILNDLGYIDSFTSVPIPLISNRILKSVYTTLTQIFNDKFNFNETYNSIFAFDAISFDDTKYANVFTDVYNESLMQSNTSNIVYEIGKMPLLQVYLNLINYAIGNLNNVSIELKEHVSLVGVYNIHRISNINNVTWQDYTIFYDYNADELNENMITNYITAKNTGITITYDTAYKETITIDYNAIDMLRVLPINSQYYGISDTVSPNFLARDFQTSKQELITFIQTYYPDLYNDLYEHSAGNFFIDIHAYLYTIWHAYIDKAQREATIGTMLETDNILEYANSYGVFVPLLVGPSVEVTYAISDVSITDSAFEISFVDHNFDNANPLTITDVVGNSWYYAATNDSAPIQLQGNSSTTEYTFSATFKLGTIKKLIYEANGDEYEYISIKDANVDVTSFVIFINGNRKYVGTQWDYVSNKIDAILRNVTLDTVNIVFGSSTYGYKLNKGDKITIIYAVLPDINSPEVNMQANTVSHETKVNITNIQGAPIYTDIKAVAIGNSGATTTLDIRTNQTAMKQYIYARRFLFNSLTTENEIESYIKTYSNKYGSLKTNLFMYRSGLDAYASNFNDYIQYKYGDANLLLVFALIPDISDVYRAYADSNPPPIIKEFYNDLLMYKSINLEIDILSGFIQRVDFLVEVNVSAVNRSILKQAIVNLIIKYFTNVDYGSTVNLSDLLFEIEKYLRERYSNIHAKAIKYKYEGETRYRTIGIYDQLQLSVAPKYFSNENKIRAQQYFGDSWMSMTDLLQASTIILPGNIDIELYTHQNQLK